MIYENYLKEDPIPHGFGMIVSLSKKAYAWLHMSREDNSVKFELVPSQEMLAEEKSRVIPVIVRYAWTTNKNKILELIVIL